jgi:hypothetical protein
MLNKNICHLGTGEFQKNAIGYYERLEENPDVIFVVHSKKKVRFIAISPEKALELGLVESLEIPKNDSQWNNKIIKTKPVKLDGLPYGPGRSRG